MRTCKTVRDRFDLRNNDRVAVCQQGNRKALVTLEPIEFPDPSLAERPWLRTWKSFAANTG